MPSRSAPAAAVPSTSSGSSNAQLGLLAACLILSGTSAYFYVTCSSSVSPIGGAGSDGASLSSSWASNGISEASSGTLFRATRSRRYSGEIMFAKWKVNRSDTPHPISGSLPAMLWCCCSLLLSSHHSWVPPRLRRIAMAALVPSSRTLAARQKQLYVQELGGDDDHLSADHHDQADRLTARLVPGHRWRQEGAQGVQCERRGNLLVACRSGEAALRHRQAPALEPLWKEEYRLPVCPAARRPVGVRHGRRQRAAEPEPRHPAAEAQQLCGRGGHGL